ncbi:MAG: hypothetical protein ABH826_01880 [Patescibacteria group bacterium]
MTRGGIRRGAGRPKGAVSEETRQRQEIKRRIVELTNERAEELFLAIMDLATGCYEESYENGIKKVYKRKPDSKSIQWLLEQTVGRASQKIDFLPEDSTVESLKITFVKNTTIQTKQDPSTIDLFLDR